MERMDQGMPFLLQYENVAWYESGRVRILDRRVYPREVRFEVCETCKPPGKRPSYHPGNNIAQIFLAFKRLVRYNGHHERAGAGPRPLKYCAASRNGSGSRR